MENLKTKTPIHGPGVVDTSDYSIENPDKRTRIVGHEGPKIANRKNFDYRLGDGDIDDGFVEYNGEGMSMIEDGISNQKNSVCEPGVGDFVQNNHERTNTVGHEAPKMENRMEPVRRLEVGETRATTTAEEVK